MNRPERLKFIPVIIIGAPRSGTNILRDVLTSIDGISTWPCDEINYIWRHGNIRYPSDEIPANMVHPKIAQYIQKSFLKIAHQQKAVVIIEKTCANSLRVPFVDRAIPNAKYVYIYRDGIDVAASAKLRWTAGLDILYILRKARYVPVIDIPYYASKYLWSRIYRIFSGERRLAFWGPILDSNKQILEQYSLIEVCAIQWQRCVEKAERAFTMMPEGRVLKLSYEDFVENPTEAIRRILEFIEHKASDEVIKTAILPVRKNIRGKARKGLQPQEIASLEVLIGNTLHRHDDKF